MRVLVVSDIHANAPALEAVFADAEQDGAVDAVWCAGDIVGYGADPSRVIELLRARPFTSVAGNHDLAASGRMGVEEFNPVAAAAALWTADQLSKDERSFLAALPMTCAASGKMTLVHGSLRAPEWEYLLTPEQAEAHLALQRTPYSIVGHSHLQFWAEERGERVAFHRVRPGDAVHLGERRLIVNPGSVGQPRDSDPRAAYLLYADQAATITYCRTEYDIAAAQRGITGAGLHPWLAERLAVGK
jgi:predicted phosphodiesterase